MDASPLDVDLDDMSATVGRKVRAARNARGMSMSELARRSGVAKGTLSQLELGRGNPTLGTIFSVASSLGVSVGSLIAGPDRPDVRVVRAGEGTELHESPVIARLLDRVNSGADHFELYDLEVTPTERRISPGYADDVFEHVYVRAGTLVVGPVSDPIELGPGDYASYRADAPHVYAATDGIARAICLVHYPSVD